jgi:hypothetical protein
MNQQKFESLYRAAKAVEDDTTVTCRRWSRSAPVRCSMPASSTHAGSFVIALVNRDDPR